jgi:hypothetical protein
MDGSCCAGNQRCDGSIGFFGTLAWFGRIAITSSSGWHYLHLRTQSIENVGWIVGWKKAGGIEAIPDG